MQQVGRYTNKSSQKVRRKYLRKHQTNAEKKLWEYLRNKQLGYKFRRQYNIDYYIVDFYCHELRLIIEADGDIHGESDQRKRDQKRQNYLKKKYTILRYTNTQIIKETDAVLHDIVNHLSIIGAAKDPT